jgi:4-amino-4-deoxy-L-arabinose transferase-like glycosyltransferase
MALNDTDQRGRVSDGDPEPPVARPRWWPGVDPLLILVGVVSLVVYALHGFDGILRRDVAIYSYAGQQVAEGVPPYVGILNRAGPLAHLLPALGVAVARVGGIDDILGMRVLFMLLAVACVCVVYLLGRAIFASRLAGLAAAAAFLSFYGFIEMATYGPREKTPMVLFLLLTLLAVVKRRWLAAGISLSLATLLWQPSFLVGGAAALVGLAVSERSGRLRALGRFVAGGLIPAAIMVVYFAAVGALKEFIDAFLLINARYTMADPLLPDFANNWRRMQLWYGASLWVMVVGMAVVLILSLAALVRAGPKGRGGNPMIAMGAALSISLVWTFRDFNSWPDAFVLLPLAAVGIGAITSLLVRRVPRGVAIPLVLVAVVAGVILATVFSTTRRDDRLPLQRAAVAAMLERLPADASILSIGAPESLVFSGKRNPTRHQMFALGLEAYVRDAYPGGLQGFGKWVGEEQPTVISIHKNHPPPWLVDTIDAGYVRVGRAPGWTWFVHRAALRDAVGASE